MNLLTSLTYLHLLQNILRNYSVIDETAEKRAREIGWLGGGWIFILILVKIPADIPSSKRHSTFELHIETSSFFQRKEYFGQLFPCLFGVFLSHSIFIIAYKELKATILLFFMMNGKQF